MLRNNNSFSVFSKKEINSHNFLFSLKTDMALVPAPISYPLSEVTASQIFSALKAAFASMPPASAALWSALGLSVGAGGFVVVMGEASRVIDEIQASQKEALARAGDGLPHFLLVDKKDAQGRVIEYSFLSKAGISKQIYESLSFEQRNAFVGYGNMLAVLLQSGALTQAQVDETLAEIGRSLGASAPASVAVPAPPAPVAPNAGGAAGGPSDPNPIFAAIMSSTRLPQGSAGYSYLSTALNAWAQNLGGRDGAAQAAYLTSLARGLSANDATALADWNAILQNASGAMLGGFVEAQLTAAKAAGWTVNNTVKAAFTQAVTGWLAREGGGDLNAVFNQLKNLANSPQTLGSLMQAAQQAAGTSVAQAPQQAPNPAPRASEAAPAPSPAPAPQADPDWLPSEESLDEIAGSNAGAFREWMRERGEADLDRYTLAELYAMFAENGASTGGSGGNNPIGRSTQVAGGG
jgi:hypothetical protein